MSASQLIKKAFASSCIFFSVIVVIYSLLVMAFFYGLEMDPLSVFLFFPFSYVITLANYVVKYTSFGKCAKTVIHFIMFTTATVLFIFIPRGSSLSPKIAMILFVLYCIFYIIGISIYFAVSSAKTRKIEKNTEYKNVY